jgi:hypothetical protein
MPSCEGPSANADLPSLLGRHTWPGGAVACSLHGYCREFPEGEQDGSAMGTNPSRVPLLSMLTAIGHFLMSFAFREGAHSRVGAMPDSWWT